MLEKGIFLRKLTNTTTVYLLCPIILQNLKKVISVGQIMRYKVLQFWVKLGTNYRLPLKEFFLKNWLMLILSTSCTYKNTTMFRKKIIKLDLWSSKGCMHRFWTNWPRVFFWGKLSVVTFNNLLCPIILKSLN